MAGTGGAAVGLGAGLGARPVARLAARCDVDLDFARAAGEGVFEPDFHVVAKVRAARGAALLTAATESRTENRFEDITDVAELGAARAAETARAAVNTCLAEPVVCRAFLRVLQAVIGFADRLETRLAVAAPRILVGMIFHRELAIARLQRRVVGSALDFEQFVIIDVERHNLSAPSPASHFRSP